MIPTNGPSGGRVAWVPAVAAFVVPWSSYTKSPRSRRAVAHPRAATHRPGSCRRPADGAGATPVSLLLERGDPVAEHIQTFMHGTQRRGQVPENNQQVVAPLDIHAGTLSTNAVPRGGAVQYLSNLAQESSKSGQMTNIRGPVTADPGVPGQLAEYRLRTDDLSTCFERLRSRAPRAVKQSQASNSVTARYLRPSVLHPLGSPLVTELRAVRCAVCAGVVPPYLADVHRHRHETERRKARSSSSRSQGSLCRSICSRGQRLLGGSQVLRAGGWLSSLPAPYGGGRDAPEE